MKNCKFNIETKDGNVFTHIEGLRCDLIKSLTIADSKSNNELAELLTEFTAIMTAYKPELLKQFNATHKKCKNTILKRDSDARQN